jgi:hypothetical protein
LAKELAKKPPKASPKKAAEKTARKAPKAKRQATPRARLPLRRTKTLKAAPAPPIPVDVAEQEALRAKFELGPHAWTQTLDARERAQTIPWGYGRDRVTAMAVDPERLFVYWEVTDEAIAASRARLSGDNSGTLVLRVHDVTGLLFDGDNAHHSFDLEIGRAERQRFHWIGRPSSSVIVELGLRGGDGRFAAITRSGRVDFPRRDPAPGGPIEWLTVREVRSDSRGFDRLDVEPASTPGAAGEGTRAGADVAPPPWPGSASVAARGPDDTGDREGRWHVPSERFDEWFAGSFGELAFDFDGQRFEWLGPREERIELGTEEWQPEAVPAAQVKRSGGAWLVERRAGHWRIVQAPWSVAITSLRGHGSRRLVSRWELRRSWIVAAGWLRAPRDAKADSDRARQPSSGGDLNGSEPRLAPGASERHFLAASELRLGGASEERLFGASELRLAGRAADELGGASEVFPPRPFAPLPPPLDHGWPSDGRLR